MSGKKAQLIDPRKEGRRALELPRPLFDEAAIARADDTLKALSGSMEQWLDADIEKLQQARTAAAAECWSAAALEALMSAAHDLKGMGATYGFPIITQIAASLCRLIETDAGKDVTRRDPTLVCAHVDALRASARDKIREAHHPIGRALLVALETHVERLGVAPR
ncbi:MAG: Hpt domain-containing protein [Phycisphaerales bacterium]|nr:Hpt domain-containing protein [Hyphomonadaceae bacterium]